MSYFDDCLPCSINNMRPNGQSGHSPISGGSLTGAGMYPSFPATGPAQPLPTGVPTGPTQAPVPTSPQIQTTIGGPVPVQTLTSTQFIPGFLRTQIGRRIRVEFLIGTNGPLVDRTGTLLAVGASYILIRPIETDDTELCDLYAIKFVTIFR